MLIRTLDDWLKANWRSREKTDTDFAAAIGCSGPHLSLIIKGDASPSLKLAVRIEEVTAGAVTPAMLFAHSAKVGTLNPAAEMSR